MAASERASGLRERLPASTGSGSRSERGSPEGPPPSGRRWPRRSAVAALAIGAVAIGALAIGRLSIGHGVDQAPRDRGARGRPPAGRELEVERGEDPGGDEAARLQRPPLRPRRRPRPWSSAARDSDVVIGAGDFASVHEGLEETIAALAAIETPTILIPGNNETEDALRAARLGLGRGDGPARRVGRDRRDHVLRPRRRDPDDAVGLELRPDRRRGRRAARRLSARRRARRPLAAARPLRQLLAGRPPRQPRDPRRDRATSSRRWRSAATSTRPGASARRSARRRSPTSAPPARPSRSESESGRTTRRASTRRSCRATLYEEELHRAPGRAGADGRTGSRRGRAGRGRLRGPRRRRQGRGDQADHRVRLAAGRPHGRAARARPSASGPSGTSSATSPTCRPPGRSSSSTAPGTTAAASSRCWASAPRTSTSASSASARPSSGCWSTTASS